jgi:ferredoxin
MRLVTEPDRCVASGQCVLIAPQVFDQDNDGMVVLINEAPDAGDWAAVEESIRVCPAAAIRAAS